MQRHISANKPSTVYLDGLEVYLVFVLTVWRTLGGPSCPPDNYQLSADQTQCFSYQQNSNTTVSYANCCPAAECGSQCTYCSGGPQSYWWTQYSVTEPNNIPTFCGSVRLHR